MKVVKFSQEVCPKCDILSEVLEAIEKTVDEEIVLTDENKDELVEKYDIMGTPLMILFDEEGNEVSRTSAYREVGQLLDFFGQI